MNDFYTARDAILTREQAEPLLAPHYDKIKTCCLGGMDAWLGFAEQMPDTRIPLLPRTMANFVNDQVVQQARAEFPDDRARGIWTFEERGFFSICIDGQLILRFKKADDDDMTRNYPTKQQVDIANQQLLIPGYADPTVVSAGYHFTKALDMIDRIVIICCFNGHHLWCIPVYDVKEGAAKDVLPFEQPKTPQRRKSRVRPKDARTPEGS